MSVTACYFAARTARTLELLADAPRSATEIADALAIHPRTARRMLARLVDERYVDHRPHARPAYTLAPRFITLARRAIQQQPPKTDPAHRPTDTRDDTANPTARAQPNHDEATRNAVVAAAEAAMRKAFEFSTPADDKEWRKDAETIAVAALTATQRRCSQ